MSATGNLIKSICEKYGVEEIPEYDFDPLSLLEKKYRKKNNISNKELWEGIDFLKQEAKKLRSKKRNKNKK